MMRTPLFWKVAVPDVGDLRSWEALGLMQVDDPHVTLLYIGGKCEEEAALANDMQVEDFRQTLEALQRVDGAEVKLRVTAVLKHSDMIMALAELPLDLPCAPSQPHLTLCRSPGVAPKFAKELLRCPQQCEVLELSPALTLQGVVGLEEALTVERPVADEIAEATAFQGTVLKVETNPRPTRQTEPTGYATFLVGEENEIQVWAARLAASAKQSPMGPTSCKLKVRVQAPGKPGHLYIKWGAVAASLDAKEINAILEARLQELL